MIILGIGAYQHDASASLVVEGELIASAAQERFDRVKHSSAFPTDAVQYCLHEAGVPLDKVDCIAFYMDYRKYLQWFMHEMGSTRFDMNLAMYKGEVEQLVHDFGYRLNLMDLNLRRIRKILGYKGQIIAVEHHKAHMACAFFNSPFEDAAVLTLDAIGEWETSAMGRACGSNIELVHSFYYPHSLGTVYKAFTVHLGFNENNAGKVMGLASYGDPSAYKSAMDELVRLTDEGFEVAAGYLIHHYPARYWSRLTVDLSKRFIEAFGPSRKPNEPITKHHEDIAAAVQDKVEETGVHLARLLYKRTGSPRLCLAGGVCLNSVMNHRIIKETPFDDIFIPPASGDDGASQGAAQWAYHVKHGRKRKPPKPFNPYIGPGWKDADVVRALEDHGLPVNKSADPHSDAALLVAKGKIVGWYRGRMEVGPRALGNRSIIADPRNPEMKDTINARIKFREPFRPFAPSCLEERTGEFFDIDRPSPYMLLVCDVREDKRHVLPAITHVDGTGRLQSVNEEMNPDYYELITRFNELTGVPVVLNTSFNVRGEPIVNTPKQAIKCFLKTGMDALVVHDYVVNKQKDLG